MRPWAWVVGVCVACGTETETGLADGFLAVEREDSAEDTGVVSTGTPDSACGETHFVDMAVTGSLRAEDRQPVVDAEVWIEQRNWGPTAVHGAGFTDADGRFRFDVEALPIVEGCWGIGPQFYAVIDAGDRVEEIGINMPLVLAWNSGRLTIDLPLILVEELQAPL